MSRTVTTSAQLPTFRELLASPQFRYGAEVVTTRGLEPVDPPGNLASFARDLLGDPRIGWISITDNPGGGPMLPPEQLEIIGVERLSAQAHPVHTRLAPRRRFRLGHPVRIHDQEVL